MKNKVSFVYFSSKNSKLYFVYEDQVYYLYADWTIMLQHAALYARKPNTSRLLVFARHDISNLVYNEPRCTQPSFSTLCDYISSMFHAKKVSEEKTQSYKQVANGV